MKRMFSEVEMCRDVAIPAKQLKKGHSPPHQQILTRLLQDLLHEKACREHGFYLAITALKSIGNINSTTDDDNPQADGVLTFPVSFTCRTFLPARGNIMETRHKALVTQFPYGTSGGRTTLPIHYLKYKESNTRDDLSSYYKTVARPRTNTLSSSKTDCSTYQVFSNDLSTKTICSYLITTISYLIPSFSSNQQAPLFILRYKTEYPSRHGLELLLLQLFVMGFRLRPTEVRNRDNSPTDLIMVEIVQIIGE